MNYDFAVEPVGLIAADNARSYLVFVQDDDNVSCRWDARLCVGVEVVEFHGGAGSLRGCYAAA